MYNTVWNISNIVYNDKHESQSVVQQTGKIIQKTRNSVEYSSFTRLTVLTSQQFELHPNTTSSRHQLHCNMHNSFYLHSPSKIIINHWETDPKMMMMMMTLVTRCLNKWSIGAMFWVVECPSWSHSTFSHCQWHGGNSHIISWSYNFSNVYPCASG